MPKIMLYRAGGMEMCEFESLPESFPQHFHDYWVVGLLKSGARTLRVQNVDALLHAGDILALNPGQPHSCREEGGKASSWLCLHISKFKLGELFPGADPECLRFRQAIWNDEEVSREIMALFAGNRQKPDTNRLLHMLERLMEPAPCAASKIFPDPFMISQHGKFPHLLELARSAGMGKFSYLRRFSAEAGITPGRYEQSMRLAKARSLLISGASLADAALVGGYYDQAHFSKAFKAAYGMTPGFAQKSLASAKGDAGK